MANYENVTEARRVDAITEMAMRDDEQVRWRELNKSSTEVVKSHGEASTEQRPLPR